MRRQVLVCQITNIDLVCPRVFNRFWQYCQIIKEFRPFCPNHNRSCKILQVRVCSHYFVFLAYKSIIFCFSTIYKIFIKFIILKPLSNAIKLVEPLKKYFCHITFEIDIYEPLHGTPSLTPFQNASDLEKCIIGNCKGRKKRKLLKKILC